MLSIMQSPEEICRAMADRVRELRLAQGWTREELANRAGIAPSTLRDFERKGHITLARLVMVASALSALSGFDQLLQPPRASSLAEIEARQTKRLRGRRTVR